MTRKGQGIKIAVEGKPKEEITFSKKQAQRVANLKKIEQRREELALEREISGVMV